MTDAGTDASARRSREEARRVPDWSDVDSVAFLVYDGMTALDLVGVFDAVTRVETMGLRDGAGDGGRAGTDGAGDDAGVDGGAADAGTDAAGDADPGRFDWDIVARTPSARATGDLHFEATAVAPDLGAYDLTVVPGGTATRELAADDPTVEWVATAADCRAVAAVCTGSLLLGAAGLLDGRRATTHRTAHDALDDHCTVLDRRVVWAGPSLVTARGVSSSVDLGLDLVEAIAGRDARRQVRDRMDYPYDPRGGT